MARTKLLSEKAMKLSDLAKILTRINPEMQPRKILTEEKVEGGRNEKIRVE